MLAYTRLRAHTSINANTHTSYSYERVFKIYPALLHKTFVGAGKYILLGAGATTASSFCRKKYQF